MLIRESLRCLLQLQIGVPIPDIVTGRGIVATRSVWTAPARWRFRQPCPRRKREQAPRAPKRFAPRNVRIALKHVTGLTFQSAQSVLREEEN